MSETDTKFETWGILELLGHLRLSGLISEQTVAGTGLIRIDVPDVNDTPGYTRYFGPSAVYSLTPTSEEIARAFAANVRAKPVSPYELNYERKSIPSDFADDKENDDDDDELDY